MPVTVGLWPTPGKGARSPGRTKGSPAWPAVPYEAHLALAGASAELVRSMVLT
jgi:hypothetical protein